MFNSKSRSFSGLRILSALILIILVFSTTPPLHSVQASSNIYVKTNGSDSSGCGSTAAPCRSIQYAVNKAVSGDSIRVAKGTYSYNAAVDKCTFLVTRAVVCILNLNLDIIGGYDGTNWSTSDPQKNPTIIDGGQTYRGVAVVAYNGTANMVMDGFTIQNGLAQGNQSSDTLANSGKGGGIWASDSTVQLRNMIFKNNRAIGANLSIASGGSGSGGGLAITSSVIRSSSLNNVVFEGNLAAGGSGATRGGVAFGGGIYAYFSTLTGTNLTFTNNTARAGDFSGSGLDAGLYADALGGAAGFCNSNTTLNHVTATGNQVLGGDAGTNGGAGGGFGGAIFNEKGNFSIADARIQGNLVQGGVAKSGGSAMGGGIMTDSSETTINRVLGNRQQGDVWWILHKLPGGCGGRRRRLLCLLGHFWCLSYIDYEFCFFG